MTTPYAPVEALPVLCATFVKIEEKLIESIITHQLLARDLYKLQPQCTSKEDLREASLYKNPGTVLHPSGKKILAYRSAVRSVADRTCNSNQ